jgi:hypothetical protein
LLVVALALPAQAQTLSVTDMRDLAYAALKSGDVLRARDIARTLLRRDSDDAAALAVMASAVLALGDATLARRAVAYLYQSSEDGGARYDAARIAADASAVLGQRGREKIWLRRAAQLSENAAQENAVARAYRNSRRADPWQRQFSFSLTPSNNLNGGASSDLLIVDGVDLEGELSPDAQALSGLRLRAGVDLKYRLKPTTRSITALGFRGDVTRNFLSARAQDLAPDLRNSALNYTLSEVSISQKRALAAQPGGGAAAVLNYGAVLGQTWYGGEDLAAYQRLTLGWSRREARRTAQHQRHG